jgi:hypothetical protein
MDSLWRELTRRQPSFEGLLQQDLFECWQHLAPLNSLKPISPSPNDPSPAAAWITRDAASPPRLSTVPTFGAYRCLHRA